MMKFRSMLQASALLLGVALFAPGAANAQCNLESLNPGLNSDCRIEVDGRMREFDVRVPRDRSAITTVMVDSHGFTSSKEGQARISGLTELVDTKGIVLIHNQGISNSHNAGVGENFRGNNCCGTALSQRVDDIGFVRMAVEAVEKSLGLDATKIRRGMGGLSNGSALTNLAACEASDFFDFFVGVSFPAPGDLTGCRPGQGTIFREFHGTSDTVVNFEGSRPLNSAPADDLSAMVQLRGCDANAEISRLNSNTMCQVFSGCEGGGSVGMCAVDGGSHVLYPNIAQPNYVDAVSDIIDEAREINRTR